MSDCHCLNMLQIYIFYSIESPPYSRIRRKEWAVYDEHFFNGTMSYRLDSDIYMPYGWTVPLDQPESGPLKTGLKMKNIEALGELPSRLKKELKGKKKLVAWVVSNCQGPGSNTILSNYVFEKNSLMHMGSS